MKLQRLQISNDSTQSPSALSRGNPISYHPLNFPGGRSSHSVQAPHVGILVRSAAQVCIFPPLGIINEVPTHKMSKRTTVPAVAASDALFEREAGLGHGQVGIAWPGCWFSNSLSRNLGRKYSARAHRPVISNRVCPRRLVRSMAGRLTIFLHV